MVTPDRSVVPADGPPEPPADPGATPTGSTTAPPPAGSTPVRSRAELDRIFGTDPVSTRDDLPDPEVPSGRDPAEAWYLENRPPHHGG
ncbi:hypothetical protein [Nakamurella deserti]|uniref:hypothetical protein n=1 Tax=Nakamurella deserti TaxID=2164074 RepID=UPI000DBE9D26|nr:hypothetical protein [Nakamurella deserti]